MEVYEGRLHSFDKPKSKSKAAASRTWPHPDTFVANPKSLAEAGFYYNPGKDNVDNVKCFICGRELGGWTENDNPFEVHVNKAPRCPWAVARCSLEFDVDSDGNFILQDTTRLPTNKFLEKARLDTFGVKQKWWPHDSVKNHGATSKQMAKAGFVYTPQIPGDDTATCFYCNLSLSGWDADDDPTEEHHKREEKSGSPCYFFKSEDQLIKQAQEKADKASRKSQAAKTALNVFEDSEEEAPAPPKRGRPKSTAVASSTSNRKKSTKPPVIIDDDVPSDELEEDDDPSLKVKPTKASKKSTKKPATKTAKSSKGKGRTAAPSEAEEEDNARTEPETKPTRTRTKTSTKEKAREVEKPPSIVDGKPPSKYEDFTININTAEEKRKGRPKAKEKGKASGTGKSRSKSKSRSAAEDSDLSSVPESQSKPLLRAAKRISSIAEAAVEDKDELSGEESDLADLGPRQGLALKAQDGLLTSRTFVRDKPSSVGSVIGKSSSGRGKAGSLTLQKAAPLERSLSKTSRANEDEKQVEESASEMEVDDDDHGMPPEEDHVPSDASTNNGEEPEPSSPSPSLPAPKSLSDFKIGPPRGAKPLITSSKLKTSSRSANNSQDLGKSSRKDAPKAKEQDENGGSASKSNQSEVALGKRVNKFLVNEVVPPSSDHNMDVDDGAIQNPLQSVKPRSVNNSQSAPEKYTLPTRTPSPRPVTPEAQILRSSPQPNYSSSNQNQGQEQEDRREEEEREIIKRQLLANVPPSPAAAFLPALASKPLVQAKSLTEEERVMTVEQWIRHEMLLQHKQLQEDGEKRIKAFLEAAEEVRARIEAL